MLPDSLSANVLIHGMTSATLRSPDGSQVVRIISHGETIRAKFAEVKDIGTTDQWRMQDRHSHHILRFNALQLWRNLLRQGRWRVPPKW
jgi:hypothetical protein